jgi:capsular exopolysaccharide synthesis family protein
LRTLAVTSPSRGDGKSTVAFNLAKAMAHLKQEVLLIDGDLRKPTQHKLANCSNDSGLSEILENARTLFESVQEISPHLHILTAGRSVSNPVALMQSPRLGDLLEEAASRYSIVLVDTPALSAVTDGVLVTARTDATVLVVAADSTNERDTKEVMARLASLGLDNLVGVVVNRDSKRFADYSDYFAKRSPLPGGAP